MRLLETVGGGGKKEVVVEATRWGGATDVPASSSMRSTL